ncbi:MAG TPA: polysaccharide deacetylase family protein [Candidatus Paceibacterota bacterium]|nr:polysaccharide deacetylase family protein [Candidatus Paceibacterota bacterium]
MARYTCFLFVPGILGIAVLASIFFLSNNQASSAKTVFLNNEALYAEVPVDATQIVPPSTASTTRINLPILVYHIVRPSYPNDDQAVRALAQTPDVFNAQMQHLRDAGYHVVSFDDLENHFQSGAPLPVKPVIISFDDGWGDQFRYAFPILQKYHYTATFFVFVNSIGTRGFLSWNDLRTLRNAGMSIESHSLSHPYLTKITDPAVLWREIDESKRILEKNLGTTINEFAYPFGQYNATTTALVKKAGYRSARGDFYTGEQFSNRLYMLSALNAPTTTALFAEKFPG